VITTQRATSFRHRPSLQAVNNTMAVSAKLFSAGLLLLALLCCASAQNWTADDAREMVSFLNCLPGGRVLFVCLGRFAAMPARWLSLLAPPGVLSIPTHTTSPTLRPPTPSPTTCLPAPPSHQQGTPGSNQCTPLCVEVASRNANLAKLVEFCKSE
jgi:hypothetical protein